MKIARIRDQGREVTGRVDSGTLVPMVGDLFGEHRFEGTKIPLDGAEFLTPLEPRNIFCIGQNYLDHIKEMNLPKPDWPNVFLKPLGSLTGHNTPVYLPARFATKVDYEAEFVVVIGKKARHVTKSAALEYVLGYTCGNDLSARNLQLPNGQWSLCKGFDTFAPLGPWIETELDPANVKVEMLVNSEVRQSTNTNQLIFDVPYLIHYFSQITTLMPGDVIFTGTSSGVGQIFDGDILEVRIDGIGSLVNPVRRELL